MGVPNGVLKEQKLEWNGRNFCMITRSPMEEKCFVKTLTQLNLMHLKTQVVILCDRQYNRRFWCLLEAYLGLHVYSLDRGLVLSEGNDEHHHLLFLGTTIKDPEYYREGLIADVNQPLDQFAKFLENSDVCLMSNGSKDTFVRRMEMLESDMQALARGIKGGDSELTEAVVLKQADGKESGRDSKSERGGCDQRKRNAFDEGDTVQAHSLNNAAVDGKRGTVAAGSSASSSTWWRFPGIGIWSTNRYRASGPTVTVGENGKFDGLRLDFAATEVNSIRFLCGKPYQVERFDGIAKEKAANEFTTYVRKHPSCPIPVHEAPSYAACVGWKIETIDGKPMPRAEEREGWLMKVTNGEACTVNFKECFPSKAQVFLRDRRDPVSICDLRLGDEVLVGNCRYEPVILFGHRDPQAVRIMQVLTISDDIGELVLSPYHHILLSDRRSVPACQVGVGDELLDVNGEKVTVECIGTTLAQGLIHPKTPSGEICVNGVLCTTFNTVPRSANQPRSLLGSSQQLLRRHAKEWFYRGLSITWKTSKLCGLHGSRRAQDLFNWYYPENFPVDYTEKPIGDSSQVLSRASLFTVACATVLVLVVTYH